MQDLDPLARQLYFNEGRQEMMVNYPRCSWFKPNCARPICPFTQHGWKMTIAPECQPLLGVTITLGEAKASCQS